MTASADLQDRVARALRMPGVLSVMVPIVPWRKKDKQSDLDAITAARSGLCIFVPMPVPTHAMQGTPDVVFDGFEVRVQIVEMPSVKPDGLPDLYDLIEEVALGLHWQPKSVDSPLAGRLLHPLYLAERPVEVAEGVVAVPGFERNGEAIRGADVIFNAVLQLNTENS